LHPELSEQELRQKTETLVGKYWCEIEAVASMLMEETTLRDDETKTICDAIEEHKDWRQILSEYRHRWLFGEQETK